MARTSIAVASVTVIMLVTSAWLRQPVSATQTGPAPGRGDEARLIAALNDCVQERFKDVDERFGYRRIVRPDETPHRFKPENVRELTAVENLDRARLRLVLYLAGRRVLRTQPDPSRIDGRWVSGLVKGPVVVTPAETVDFGGSGSAAMPPAPLDLLDQSRRAMIAFDSAEAQEFAVGPWNFIAHPVRANDTICLKCHRAQRAMTIPSQVASDSSVRVGDPLGVVLYGFQRR